MNAAPRVRPSWTRLRRLLLRSLTLLLMAATLLPMLTENASAALRRGRLRVKVVDVAGGRAYVAPGAEEGLHVDATVRIDGHAYKVREVTASYGVLEIGEHALRIGEQGSAIVDERRAKGATERLTPPKALDEYEGQWPEAEKPSGAQSPEAIPLGPMQRPRRLRLSVTGNGALLLPLRRPDETVGIGGLRARVHAEPFRELPLAVDADAALELWLGGGLDPSASRSRRRIQVRQLQIAWGQQDQFYAALGRLRYAASTLGQLDGLRVQSPRLGPLAFGAFGGFVPNPQTGRPAFNAARFGAEATFHDPEAGLRPLLRLVGHGSLFEGEPDERRLTASFQLQPGKSYVGGSVEVSNFDANNEWGVERVDVTAASLDTTLRFGSFRIGARASMRQPERSKWLASYLPPGWLCRWTPDPTGGADLCNGSAGRRFMGTATAGFELERIAISAGSTAIYVRGLPGLNQLGGFASFRALRIFDIARFDLSLMASNGVVLETWGGSAALGVSLGGDLIDATVRYRPAYTRFGADVDYFLEHQVGGHVLVRPIRDLDILLDAQGLFGRQVNALIAQLAVTWHLAL